MSSKNRARGARPWGGAPRSVAIPTVLLLVAPLLVLVFAAVIFGMGARPRLRARTAADIAAAPASALERTPTRQVGRFHSALQALRPTSTRALASAAAIAAGVLFASTGALGSFAYLNSQKSIGSGGVVLTAGTLGLSVNGSTSSAPVALPATFTKLLPGTYFSQNITVANTGNTRGVISVVLAAAPAPYEVRLSNAACAATGYGTAAITAPALSTAATTYGTVPASSSYTGCLQIGLAAAAAATGNGTATVTAQTASGSFALTFTATEPSS